MATESDTPKSGKPEDSDHRVKDENIARTHRQPAPYPCLPTNPMASGGVWGGGGGEGSDARTGVGTSVGIGVGTSVGIGAGTSVGIGAGTSVGIGAGTSVGIGAGTSVGIGVGTSVGIGTGTGAGVNASLAGGGFSEGGAPIDASCAEAGLRQVLLMARQQELLTTRSSRAATAESRRLTPRDLWKTVQVAQPALSPCGDWVAFVRLERPSGGNLQTEQIIIKRVGSCPGEDEYPLTDNTVLADSPVWKPHVFHNLKSAPAESDVPEKTEILFRARATMVDVMQLYIIEVQLPGPDDDTMRIGRVRRLTNSMSHPWAPKWRRFRDGDGLEHSRIYYVAAGTEAVPVGYDHLVFDSALVGWWDNLRLPHDRWRFYEVDACAPGAPLDLLGTHQPLLDFVNGVWNCWDVHPGGQGIVWAAVNRSPDPTDESPAPKWPNEITLDIYRLRLHARPHDEGQAGCCRVTCLTDRIRVPDPEWRKAEGGGASGMMTGPRRGRFDDYMPQYSPCGTYIVYAEKQFSTLPADYPRIVRLRLPRLDANEIVEGEDVFEIIKHPARDAATTAERDTVLPLNWKFSGAHELLVVIEGGGHHRLMRLAVPAVQPPPALGNLPEPIDWEEKAGAANVEGGSVMDFDVNPTTAKRPSMSYCVVTSGLVTPPELRFSDKTETATDYNRPNHDKIRMIEVKSELFSREEPLSERIFGTSCNQVQAWLVFPKDIGSLVCAESAVCHEKYPLVQLLHGGPNSAWIDEFHTRFNASLLASQGYIVALANFRGSTGTPEFEPDVAGETAKPARSDFLNNLKQAKPDGVDEVVKLALKYLQTDEGKTSKEGGRIQSDLNDGRFKLRHLRKIERHAARPHVLDFLAALNDTQFETLVARPDEADRRGWGRAMSDVDVVTSALLERGYVDADRVAVIGGSYGAYLGARLLGWRRRRNRYRAYVLHAGVYDPLSQFATDAFWVQYQNFGDRPWMRHRGDEATSPDFDDGDPYAWQNFSRISPLLRSERLVAEAGDKDAPAVLITHGLNDLRVHWQQSVLLHRMLKDRGITSRLALYPGLGHRLDQPEQSVQWWTAALAWLRDNGVPPGKR